MATTPSPLPLPQPVELGPMEIMQMAAANATASSRPEVTANVASSAQSVDQAVQGAQAANQFADVAQVADKLSQQSISSQQDAWKTYSPDEQAQLRQAGYKVPGHPSIWSRIAHDFGGPQGFKTLIQPGKFASDALGVVGQGLHDTVGQLGGAGSDVLNAAGSPLRASTHLFRTGALIFGDPNRAAAAGIPSSLTDVRFLSPGDWAKAWNETSNGQHFIDPVIERQVINQYGHDTFNLARQLATGTSAQQLVQDAQKQDPSGKLAQQVASEIQTNPNLKQAVSLLNAGHLSFGRITVGADFIARHPAVGNAVSGILDGVYDWFGDPLNVGGGVIKSAREAYYVVNSADDVANLSRDPGVQRKFTQLASQVKTVNDNSGTFLDWLSAHGYGELASQMRGQGNEAMNKLMNQAPQLRVVQGLIAAKADTAEKVSQWFQDQMGEKALLNGDVIKYGDVVGTQIPHISRIGQARLEAKGALLKKIDYSADKPATINGVGPEDTIISPLRPQGTLDKITVGTGRGIRRLLTLVPQTTVFNPNDPRALENLRDIALYFLPRGNVDNILREFATEPDLGARWKIYRSVMLQLGHAAGLSRDPDVWDAYIGKYASTEGRVFAPAGKDLVRVNGQDLHAGILKNDMNSGWLIPKFQDMYRMGKKFGVAQATGNKIKPEQIDRIMNDWRSLTLARPAFAARAGGEEAFRFLVAEGPVAYMKAQSARMYLKASQREQSAWGPKLSDIEANGGGHIWNRLAGALPKKVQDNIHTMGDLMREYVVDQTRRSMLRTGQALSEGELRSAVDELIKRHWMEPGGPFDKYLGAMHGGYDPQNMQGGLEGTRLKDMMKVDGKLVPGEMRGSGNFKLYDTTDPYFYHMWHLVLSQIASDDWGREALLAKWPITHAQRLSNVADKLQQDELWKASIRSVQNRAGALVKTGEITERQAAEDHAQAVLDLVDSATGHFVQNAKGEWKYKEIKVGVNPETGKDITLKEHLLKNGRPPMLPALQKTSALPHMVRGPELVASLHNPSMIHKYSDWLFGKVIGPQMNWISRQPITIHNYAEARKNLTPWAAGLRKSGMDEKHISDLVHQRAFQRAIDKTLPYVHNPHLRSQMSTITRNLAPFWFAQEQFYKRWARTLVESPAALRKAQLVAQGVAHSGFTHKDPETGNEYFVYPGSDVVQSVIAHALTTMSLGHFNALAPVAGTLIGQTNMLNPGIERMGGPSFGPLAVVPMNALKMIDPSMHGLVNSVEGQQAANTGFLKAILPSSIARTIDVFDPNALNSAQYASAQLQAIRALEASGNGVGEAAVTQVAGPNIPKPTPGDYYLDSAGNPMVYQPDGQWKSNGPQDMQNYMNKVKNWARVLFITRLIYGMSMPASPETQFNPGGLNTEYLQLVNQLGPSQGAQAFLALHPNATAETVASTTANMSDAQLPATKAAMTFLSSNPGLLKSHADAAPFFIPQPDTTGKFDLQAYQEQLQSGFRAKRDPKSFYEQAVYQASANIYYTNEDAKNKMIAADPGRRSQINNTWTQWSERFMAMNPIFANLYSNQGETTRMQIMTDVGNALRDGSAPTNAQTAALGILYDSWVFWKSQTASFGNPNQPPVSSAQAKNVDQQFATWLQGFVAENPGVKPLVDRTIRPDLSQTINQLAANGTSITI